MATQLHDLSALEQVAAVREGSTSATELVQHYAGRIEARNETVGAFVTLTFDAAREQAAGIDEQVRAGEALPPLAGVPIGVKDLNLTAGVPTQFGSVVYAGFVPPVSDVVVERMRAAGTISLGKTSTPEFGLPCYTEPEGAPPARTPWDLSRSAGGSSGGAGAAVASGLLPFAQGSDGGGSIRIPASVCGLFGIKPARGRVTSAPLPVNAAGLSSNGPLARTVRDAAALLDILAGPATGDPYWASPPPQSFLASCEQEPGRLRIGRYCDNGLAPDGLHPEVAGTWESASPAACRAGPRRRGHRLAVRAEPGALVRDRLGGHRGRHARRSRPRARAAAAEPVAARARESRERPGVHRRGGRAAAREPGRDRRHR